MDNAYEHETVRQHTERMRRERQAPTIEDQWAQSDRDRQASEEHQRRCEQVSRDIVAAHWGDMDAKQRVAEYKREGRRIEKAIAAEEAECEADTRSYDAPDED